MVANRELQAFEEYYQLTKTGIKTKDAVERVADKFGVGMRTVYRWKKEFNWDKEATERSIKANEELAEDIKSESDAVVKDFRKPFIGILNRLVAHCVHENSVQIKSVKDLVLVMETVSKLEKEMDIGRTQIVSSEYDRNKHMNAINSVLRELKKDDIDTMKKRQEMEEEDRNNAGRLSKAEV